MPLEQAHIIDAIAHDEATGEIALIMTESRPWNGADRRLYELQEKVNAYLSFALDGEMAESYPHFAGKTIRLQLDCTGPPDPRTLQFIGIMSEQIAFQGIKFEVRIMQQTGCSCGENECCRSEHSNDKPLCE